MDEILNLIESVSEGFPSYFHKVSFVSMANPRKPFYPPSGHKPSPSLHSVVPIRMLPNSNLLVKTKVTFSYLSLFGIIANNQVILFLIVLF